MTRVKICGIRSREEAVVAYEAGAWAIGEVFAPSRRQVDVKQAAFINRDLPADLLKVGVFVNEPLDSLQSIIAGCGLDMVQLHGEEPPSYMDEIKVPVVKAFKLDRPVDPRYIKRWRAEAYLFDTATPGGGQVFNWHWLKELRHWPNIILAGGLGPDNVSQAIKNLRPMAVDVSSGVEFSGGGKDPHKIYEFFKHVREADSCLSGS
jgi:phosphoribosylanthranilate isomerase